MITLSKTLLMSDYEKFDDHKDIKAVEELLRKHRVPNRNEHPNRKFEYGLTLKAFRAAQTKTVLDVGGGGSIFAPLAVLNGVDYFLQVDPGDVGKWIEQQHKVVKKSLSFVQQDFLIWGDDRLFDAVISLSVIEHVPSDLDFYRKLLSKVRDGGLLCLTTDFHPSGVALVDGHIRTYNKEGMTRFIDIGRELGFAPFLGEPDYDSFEVNVNSYTFASLIMRKEE